MFLYSTFPIKVFGWGWPRCCWPHTGPVTERHHFNRFSCFGTFHSITSVDWNRSTIQNLMFQKLIMYNFQNNSHVCCKTWLLQTFRLRNNEFGILVFWDVTLYCWISGSFQTSRTRFPAIQYHIWEDWIINYMAFKHQKFTQQSIFLFLRML
jgi:hypothetical protein